MGSRGGEGGLYGRTGAFVGMLSSNQSPLEEAGDGQVWV